jgi:pilus assembly protein CpaF
MVLSTSIDLPLEAVRAQTQSALDLQVHQVRRPNGRRIITQISRLAGYDADRPVPRDIFAFAGGEGAGTLAPTGVLPRCLKKLAIYGVQVDLDLFVPGTSRTHDVHHDDRVVVANREVAL